MWKINQDTSNSQGMKLKIVRDTRPRPPLRLRRRSVLQPEVKKISEEDVVNPVTPTPTQLERLLQGNQNGTMGIEEQDSTTKSEKTKKSYPKDDDDRPYACPYCSKSFKQLHHREDHIRIHTGERPFSCSFCSKTFNQPSNLRQHIKGVHIGDKDHPCPSCPEGFKTSDDLKIHLQIHQTQTASFKCSYCPLTFSYQHFRQVHEQTHMISDSDQEEWETGTELERKTEPETSQEFKIPELCHTDITPVEDDMDSMDSSSSSCYGDEDEYDLDGVDNDLEPSFSINSAFNIGAVTIEPIFIEQQEKAANFEKQRKILQGANLKVKAEEKNLNHTCLICRKGFKSQGFLQTHIRSLHTFTEPQGTSFKCKYCPRVLVTKQTLKYHLRTHTGEKPYICPYCNRAFARTGTLNTHIKQHTGDKPFVCSLCHKSFARATVLAVHEKSHLGNKAFRCRLCHVGFGDKKSLAEHEGACSEMEFEGVHIAPEAVLEDFE